MKNVNKANAGRTQIADISVAGKELSEEHLRIVAGGMPVSGLTWMTKACQPTCAWNALYGREICWSDCWSKDDSNNIGSY